jgi:DNA-binding NarL/FixJ family response regulator
MKNPVYLNQLLKTGAAAFLTKNCARDELIQAVRFVRNEEIQISEEFSRLVVLGRINRSASASLSTLSRREFEVLLMLSEGRSPNEIADQLNISSKTVASYKRRIHGKLNTRNTADITRIAVQSGMLTKA